MTFLLCYFTKEMSINPLFVRSIPHKYVAYPRHSLVLHVSKNICSLSRTKTLLEVREKCSPDIFAKAKTWASPRRQPERKYQANECLRESPISFSSSSLVELAGRPSRCIQQNAHRSVLQFPTQRTQVRCLSSTKTPFGIFLCGIREFPSTQNNSVELFWSGHRLACSSTDSHWLRRSIPYASKNICSLSPRQ